MSTGPLFMKQGTQYYWYHNDHLGTPQMMTTSSGAVVWRANHTSFGKATVDSSSTVVNPLRFPGQYEDSETELYYNWNRYYNPENGRYFVTDPIGLLRGINQYLYCSNNSISWIDPFGLLKYYGNWGGPDWTGGYKKSWDQLSEYERKHVLAPIDSQDECYMGHYIGYGKCRLRYKDRAYSLCREIAEGNCSNREDTKLQGCLSALPPDPANWPIAPKNARD